MSAAQLSELRRPDASASRPVLLSIDKVGFSVRSGNGKLVILEDLSLEVREGEFVSIIGGSGCGKTTLLRLIGGLNLPTSGTIRFDGAVVDRPSRKRAVVFQDYTKALLPWRTVVGNIKLALDPEIRRQTRMPRRSIGCCTRLGCRMRRIAFRGSFPAACSSGCRLRVASRWNQKCF